MNNQQLGGVRVAVLAADGFEQIEVTAPVKALRKAGADVRILSLRPGRIRGMNFLWRGRKLAVDDTVGRAQAQDYGALFLPGGFVNPDLLRQSEQARGLVARFNELGRPIATICHGPEVLISSGVAKGRTLTSWPGIADDVRNAGASWVNESVVRDGNLISSRSPSDLPAFIPAMLELFASKAPAATSKLRRPLRVSAVLSQAVSLAILTVAVVGARVAWRRLAKD